MDQNNATVTPVVEVTTTLPAPGADDQKPNLPPEGEAPPETQETTEQTEARRQSKFQRRLDRQKSARVAAETEARLLRERLEKLEAQAKPSQETDEPKESDFKDYTEYTRALARWEGKQSATATLKAEREAREGKEKQQQSNAGSEKLAKDWAEREKTFKASTKDYETLVDAFTGEGGEIESLSREARMAIVRAGPELLYYLAKHADEAERLADLSVEEQVMELGAIRAKVTVPGKKTTNAPEPAKTTTGGRTATTDLEKMTQAEYEAHRKTQGARWAR